MLIDTAKHKSDCLFFEWKYVNYLDPLFNVSKYWNSGNNMFIAQCRMAQTKEWFNRPVLYPCEQCPYYEQTAYAACRFVIFDENDQQVVGASQADFTVFERAIATTNYAKMRILDFSSSDELALPDTSVICIDNGSTLSDQLGNIRAAMHNWVEGAWYHWENMMGAIDPFDDYLIAFGGTNAPTADMFGLIETGPIVVLDPPRPPVQTVSVLQAIGGGDYNKAAIENEIDGITVSTTGTAIFDSLIRAVALLAYSDTYGTLSIYLVSNGNDDCSTHTKQDAIDAAVAAGVKIHALTISGNQSDPTVMTDLAADTGGTYALCSSLEDIQAAAEIIRGTERGGGYQMLWRTGVSPTRIGQAKAVHTSGAEDVETFRAVRVPFNYESAPERDPPTAW